MRISSRSLGQFLVARRVLSRDDLDDLLAREATEGTHLSHLLLQGGLVGERDLMAAVANELGVPFVELAEQSILADAWALLPEQVAREHVAVAVERRGEAVVVAMLDPGDEATVQAVTEAVGGPILPAVAVREELLELLTAMYGVGPGDPGGSDAGADVTARPGPAELRVDELLERVIRAGASDLHLTVGAPPTLRVQGELRRLDRIGALNGSQVRGLVLGILSPDQRERFEQTGSLETAHSLPGRGRFRVSAFVQRSSVGAVFRLVPRQVPDAEVLDLPTQVLGFADHTRGLALVCGPHLSGTSTTLAVLVDRINQARACHVLTVEDPIEFLHRHRTALVNQREVGDDVASIAEGLRSALRQDPDVLVASELPDVTSIRLALAAAETGHLVLATMRSLDAIGALGRIIDAVPSGDRDQVRIQLAATLRGIVVQQLVPAIDGGMALAAEVLMPTDTVLRAIRDDDLSAVPNAMLQGSGSGMRTMDQSLSDLVRAGRVTREAALAVALDRAELDYLLSEDSA
jgi:twitching motility protein PilT